MNSGNFTYWPFKAQIKKWGFYLFFEQLRFCLLLSSGRDKSSIRLAERQASSALWAAGERAEGRPWSRVDEKKEMSKGWGGNDVTLAGRDKHVKRRRLIPSSTEGPRLDPANDEADPYPFEA